MKYEAIVKPRTNTLLWKRICDFLLMAQMVKNLSVIQGNCVLSLGMEEENDYPFQNLCMENSMDRGSWWATIHGDHRELDPTERLTCLLSFSDQLSLLMESSVTCRSRSYKRKHSFYKEYFFLHHEILHNLGLLGLWNPKIKSLF